MAGFGTGSGAGAGPGGFATASGVAIAGAVLVATTVTLGTQGYTNGKIRVKVYNGGSSDVTATIGVTVTDGTNVVTVLPATPAAPVANTPAGGVDLLVDLLVDILITSVTINVTLAAGTTKTASLDYEVDLNP
jgi:hypothetical protein